jgi:hypothetical protein
MDLVSTLQEDRSEDCSALIEPEKTDLIMHRATEE